MEDQFEIDEELLNLVNLDETIAASQESSEGHEVIFFNCSGEDSKKVKISKTGYIGRSDITQLYKNAKLPQDVDEFDSNVFTSFEVIQMLYQKARMNTQMLEVGVLSSTNFIGDTTYFTLRQDVTLLLFYYRQSIESFDRPTLERMLSNFRISLSTLDSLQNVTALSTSYNTKGNESLSAQYHLFHGNLEWRWLLLTIQLKICQTEKKEFNKSLRGSAFDVELELFMYDLICISMCKYNKKTQAELIHGTPFPCACVKETWLLVVQLVGKLNEMNEINSFWTYFNKTIDDVREDRNSYTRFTESDARVKIMLRKSVPITCKTPINFSIWLLCGVATLFGLNDKGETIPVHQFSLFGNEKLKENQEFLEELLKSYLKTDPSEDKLRALMFMLSPVILEWWSPKPEIIILLWEHFHKRLNSNFYIAGAAITSLAISSDTAKGYIDQAEQNLSTAPNPNHSSYSIFVRAMGKMLLRFAQISQKPQIQKLLGRIYSKFPSTKLLALNETGIHNVTSLFLTITLTGDLNEVGQKVLDMLTLIPIDTITPARQAAVTKAHVSMLLLLHKKQFNMTNYINKFFLQLKTVYEKNEPASNGSTCLKILADGVAEIFANHNQYYENGEHLLIDSWIKKFLVQNSTAEQERLLSTVNSILVKLKENRHTSNSTNKNDLALMQSIYTFVLPHVKQTFLQSSNSLVIPEMAANFALCATGRDGLPKFADLYSFFIEANCGNVLNTSKFLIHILSNDQRPQIDDAIIIQNWIKCMLMQEDGSSMDMSRLTAAVVALDEFKEIYSGDELQFLNSKDPLRSFFMEIGRKYASSDYKKRCEITEKLNQYLKSFEKWAADGLKTQSTSFKIFNMIAVTFLYCSKIIYSRSRASCFFNVVMSQFILPTALLIGKAQPQHLSLAVMRIWHILIEGISHLDYKCDAYVTKTLSDLITKWTPHFNIGNNAKLAARPYMCLMKNENHEILLFVLEKFSSTFLAAQREPHANACLALTIAGEVLNAVSNDETKLQLFIKSISSNLIQHAMLTDELVPSKNISYTLLQTILNTPSYRASFELREIFVNNLKVITNKYLSLYDKFYFTFMLKLTKINAVLVGEILGHLKQQIHDTEQRRGVAHDHRLRNQYDHLEGAVLAAAKRN